MKNARTPIILRQPDRPFIYCALCGSSRDIVQMDGLLLGLDDPTCCEPPPITGAADLEYKTRIDADRVTAEFRVAITPRKPQASIDDLPLFGGERQQEMF